METTLAKGESVNFLDYTIKNCLNNDGIVLLKQSNNVKLYERHLGNYSTLEAAQKSALIHFMVARPENFADNIASRILYKRGLHLEYLTFREVCIKEGVQIPEIINHTSCGNMLITLNGEFI